MKVPPETVKEAIKGQFINNTALYRKQPEAEPARKKLLIQATIVLKTNIILHSCCHCNCI